MEKIQIKTHGQFKLTAWKDKIQFIALTELLKSMNVEYIEEVIEYIKQDTTWYSYVGKVELPAMGETDVIQITRALGLIQWLPVGIVEFLPRHEVFNALVIHLENYLEFFQWKLAEVEKCIGDIQCAQKELDKSKDYTIEQQNQLIDKLKEALNIKTISDGK